MKLKQLFADDNAVSPVIGVILMVAITVILAAVIGTFVLGLGDNLQETSPTASFSTDYAASGGDGSGSLTLTHDGGDAIAASQVTIKSSDGDSAAWPDIGSTDETASDDIRAGSSVTLDGTIIGWPSDITGSETVRVVWESESGDKSATLTKWSGPDA